MSDECYYVRFCIRVTLTDGCIQFAVVVVAFENKATFEVAETEELDSLFKILSTSKEIPADWDALTILESEEFDVLRSEGEDFVVYA